MSTETTADIDDLYNALSLRIERISVLVGSLDAHIYQHHADSTALLVIVDLLRRELDESKQEQNL